MTVEVLLTGEIDTARAAAEAFALAHERWPSLGMASQASALAAARAETVRN